MPLYTTKDSGNILTPKGKSIMARIQNCVIHRAKYNVDLNINNMNLVLFFINADVLIDVVDRNGNVNGIFNGKFVTALDIKRAVFLIYHTCS